MRDCPEKRKVPGNKGQKVTGCFRCRSVKHSVRNISQSAAAEKLGFWVEGADRERGWGLVLCHGNTVSQAYRGHLSSAEDVLLISACELKDRLDLSRAAGNKLTSHRMLVMQAALNGHCIFCLVDTVSEWTLVSPWLVYGQADQVDRGWQCFPCLTHVLYYCWTAGTLLSCTCTGDEGTGQLWS